MNGISRATGVLERVWMIAIVFLLLFLCARADSQTLEKTRLGVSDVSFTLLPHLIAKETGIFQKRGLQVEVIFIGRPVGTAALAAGELDYSASTDSGMPAAVQGVPIKAVLFAMKAPPFYLISQPRLKKITDLPGKKVGLSRLGTSPYFASRRIFKKFGVDAEKITYIQAGTNMNRLITLTNGSLDASMLSLPTARIMIDKGFTELASPRDIGLVPHAGLECPDRYHREKSRAGEKNDRIVGRRDGVHGQQQSQSDRLYLQQMEAESRTERRAPGERSPSSVNDGWKNAPRASAGHLDTEHQNKLISRRAQASEVMDLSMLEEVHAKK